MIDLLDTIPVNSGTEGQLTPRQRDLVDRLIAEIAELDTDTAEQARAYTDRMNGHWTIGRGGNASFWIDRLIRKARELKAIRPTQIAIDDGMYQFNGEIFKVQHAVHSSGNQYAKRLVPNEPGERAQFVYAPGIIRHLHPEHRMTMEQAKEFGAIYGTCCVCGRLLTNETSIEAGIGPVCAGRF